MRDDLAAQSAHLEGAAVDLCLVSGLRQAHALKTEVLWQQEHLSTSCWTVDFQYIFLFKARGGVGSRRRKVVARGS